VDALRGKPVGTTFTIGITRAGAASTVQVATAAGADGVPRIGVTPEIVSTAPFKVKIPIENIGGPSAGLMLTLGIIDKIKPEDLTGGKIIAGTGTIDADGKVGPIGGIPQKLVASKAAGAAFFLTPKDNCAEAVDNQQKGLPLVEVASLNDALAALTDIRAGKQPPLCPGAS
jgi:PDZ domain-containing protein